MLEDAQLNENEKKFMAESAKGLELLDQSYDFGAMSEEELRAFGPTLCALNHDLGSRIEKLESVKESLEFRYSKQIAAAPAEPQLYKQALGDYKLSDQQRLVELLRELRPYTLTGSQLERSVQGEYQVAHIENLDEIWAYRPVSESDIEKCYPGEEEAEKIAELGGRQVEPLLDPIGFAEELVERKGSVEERLRSLEAIAKECKT